MLFALHRASRVSVDNGTNNNSLNRRKEEIMRQNASKHTHTHTHIACACFQNLYQLCWNQQKHRNWTLFVSILSFACLWFQANTLSMVHFNRHFLRTCQFTIVFFSSFFWMEVVWFDTVFLVCYDKTHYGDVITSQPLSHFRCKSVDSIEYWKTHNPSLHPFES